MIRITERKLPLSAVPVEARRAVDAPAETDEDRAPVPHPIAALTTLRVFKRNFDARKSVLLVVYIVGLALGRPAQESTLLKQHAKHPYISATPDLAQRPVVVGFGPCGMFAALVLAPMEFKPIVLERGTTVPPQWLEIEILETSALQDIGHVSGIMRACQALGVRFALDDFGTGYSSLSHLKRLPAELIKIDQGFIRNMLGDVEHLAIVKGVIGLARAFNREVIAEGVETIAHGCALLALDCELAQGYGIARPMPADALPGRVASWQPDPAWQISA